MSWWKQAKNETLEDRIKSHIRSSSFFVKLFHLFHVPLEALDKLSIQIKRLEKQFCKADTDSITVDDRLVSRKDFFTTQFHFLAHEILHWLKRQREQAHYFADPEEIESFNTAIAYALFSKDPNLVETFLPLIQINIKDDIKAMAFLKERVKNAKELLRKMQI